MNQFGILQHVDYPIMATPYQNIMAGTSAGLHPILQQIDELNAKYQPPVPARTDTGTTAENKENEELVKLQEEGVQEAVR